MMMALNCMEIWLMGMFRVRLKVKKLASLPRVRPVMPDSASAPPIMAQNT